MGTTQTFSDAVVAQAIALATLWTPEGLSPLLVSEFVEGGSAAASIINHAAPASPGFEFGSVLSATITAAGSGGTQGTYTGIAATGGGGTGATATVVVGAGGNVTSVTLTTRGDNYTTTPVLPLTSIPGLTGAVVTLSLIKPTYNAKSALVGNGAGNTPNGINTGQVGAEGEQTMILVCKQPNNVGGVVSRAGFLGFLFGNTSGKMGFYNDQSGVAPGVAHVSPTNTTDFNCYIGSGAVGGMGRISVGAGGALSAPVDGTTAGASTRPTTNNLRIGGGPNCEVAFFGRASVVLTEAQKLAWYQYLRGDGTAAGSPLGVVIA